MGLYSIVLWTKKTDELGATNCRAEPGSYGTMDNGVPGGPWQTPGIPVSAACAAVGPAGERDNVRQPDSEHRTPGAGGRTSGNAGAASRILHPLHILYNVYQDFPGLEAGWPQ